MSKTRRECSRCNGDQYLQPCSQCGEGTGLCTSTHDECRTLPPHPEHKLRVVPITLKDAAVLVEKWHSHLHAPVTKDGTPQALFAAAVERYGEREFGTIVCVAIMGRPKAILLDSKKLEPRKCIELVRVASDGSTKHAASMAGSATSRAALALGYRRLVSETLLGEPGTMYRAMGWWPTHISVGGSWDRYGRDREDPAQGGQKVRWEYGPEAWPRKPEIDEAVRAAVGVVPVPSRRENMPLFATMSSDDGKERCAAVVNVDVSRVDRTE